MKKTLIFEDWTTAVKTDQKLTDAIGRYHRNSQQLSQASSWLE
jgi:hypothetical protein